MARCILSGRPSPQTRAGVCLLLFFSGFVSLIGGLAAGRPGYQFASRTEIDFVAAAVRRLPIETRFAGFPTYNHSLLLNGRKMVCGYGGHLWTQGINYTQVENKLHDLMLGQGDWKLAAMLGAFFGWERMLLTILLASIAGTIVGLALMVTRGRSSQHPLPLGTFLGLGGILVLLVGDPALDWYRHLWRP